LVKVHQHLLNGLTLASSTSIEWLDPSWLAGWDNRIKFTIDNTKIDDDLTHFPVTVFLDSTQGEEVFTEFDADADYLKVAFTKDDGVTELYAEKELFAFDTPTGGTITTNGDKTVHTFTSDGTFTIPAGQSGDIEYLVVAGGGGGGGSYAGGGGGAGGYRTDTGYGVSAGGYSITVGSGGAGGHFDNVDGVTGEDSVFDTITSDGGGGGASYSGVGLAGGSGGGGSGNNFAGGAGIGGQGNAGGNSATAANWGCGGGGGATAAGAVGITTNGGNGGNGTASSILNGSPITYAGGGGGGIQTAGTEGSGGIGGGGDAGAATGSGYNDGIAGDTNTGGGGGGGSGDGSNNSATGGAGGSGIVIISYITADFISTTTGKAIYHISKTGWEISSSTDTDFYMYYDNDHADNTDYIGAINTTAGAAVWDSNFKMVQHMTDDTTSAVKDSTSNSNDGTKTSANNPIEATGKIGQGQDFDGTNDYIDFGTSATLKPTSAITLEAVTKPDNTTPILISNRDGSGQNNYQLYNNNFDYYSMLFWGLTTVTVISDTLIDTTDYHHIVTYYDGSNIGFYRDGVADGSESSSGSINSGAAASLWIGSGHYTAYTDGVIDEARISSIFRGSAWIKGTYNSLWDTLLTYGTEEEYVHPVPADFANRIKLTIDHTKIDSTLTHFPVTVILSSTHGDSVFDELTSDNNRFKIAFTESDGSTQLYGEIEKWDDASESAVIHVSRSGWEISSSADTDFYMYYDSSLNDNFAYIGDIASTPGESVWDSNFKMVQHMVDDTTSAVKDSTSNSNDGTKKGANEPIEVTGKVGQGQNFSSDHISITDVDSLDFGVGSFTITCLFNEDAYTSGYAYTNIISKRYGTEAYGPGLEIYIWDNGRLQLTTSYDGESTVQTTTGLISLDTSYLATFRRNSDGTMSIDLDGVNKVSEVLTVRNVTNGQPLWLGDDNRNPDIGINLDGIIDEVRVSTTDRSTAWIKATYNLLWDTLLTYGVQEDNTAPTAPNTLYSNNANAQAGKENPTGITDTTPVFSAVYNDPDAGDIANKYRIQVATSSDFATSSVFWDSGSSGISMSNCVQGDRCQDVEYASTTVLGLDATKYYWRIKFWDGGTGWDGTEEGAWSTETAHFTMVTAILFMTAPTIGLFILTIIATLSMKNPQTVQLGMEQLLK